MPVSDYYELLVFEDGKKINVSRTVDTGVNNQIHWHPYAEILLSLSGRNTATVNFNGYELRINDMMIIYPGELHSVQSSGDDSWLIIQFPMELLSTIGELSALVSGFPRRHCVRYDPVRFSSGHMVMTVKEIAELYFSRQPFRETKMYACMLNFFAELGEYWENAEENEHTKSTGKEQESLKLMAEACLYITNNCAASHAGQRGPSYGNQQVAFFTSFQTLYQHDLHRLPDHRADPQGGKHLPGPVEADHGSRL